MAKVVRVGRKELGAGMDSCGYKKDVPIEIMRGRRVHKKKNGVEKGKNEFIFYT